jgi:hypothetical protein
MSTNSRPRATFGTGKKNHLGVISRAQVMHGAIFTTNVSMFVTPSVTAVAFLALITALITAQGAVTGTKAKGTATLRNTKRDAVWTAMDLLRAYVQGLADVLPADGASAIIEAAGLVVAATPMRKKAPLAVMLTATPGVVHLDANASIFVGSANAAKKFIFNWQWSNDAGKTWNDVRSTPYASTDIVGLAPMSTYSFRASVTIGRSAGAWSQAVNLLVH